MYPFRLNEDDDPLLKQLLSRDEPTPPPADVTTQPPVATQQPPASNPQPQSQPADTTPQSGWQSNLDRLNALVGQQRGFDPELQKRHKELEEQALTEAKSGGEYNVAKAIRDLVPMALGSLLAGTMAKDKGLALGNVAAASMDQIGRNTDRDFKVREAARQHALNEAASRMSKGGTEFSQLAQAIGLQQTDQQLKNRTLELGQLGEARKMQILKGQQELEKGSVNSERTNMQRAALNARFEAIGLKDAQGNLVQIPDNVHPDDFLKDKTLEPSIRLQMQPEFDRLAEKTAGKQAAASGYGSEVGHAKGAADAAPTVIKTTNEIRKKTGGLSEQEKVDNARAEKLAADPATKITKLLDILNENIDPQTGAIPGVTPERSRWGAGFAELQQNISQTINPPTGQAAINSAVWNQIKLSMQSALNDANLTATQKNAIEGQFRVLTNPNATADERRQAIDGYRLIVQPKVIAPSQSAPAGGSFRERFGNRRVK